MDAPIVALLARFIASEPGHATELIKWLVINGVFSGDARDFMRLVKSEIEQNISEGTDLTAFEAVANEAWTGWQPSE